MRQGIYAGNLHGDGISLLSISGKIIVYMSAHFSSSVLPRLFLRDRNISRAASLSHGPVQSSDCSGQGSASR